MPKWIVGHVDRIMYSRTCVDMVQCLKKVERKCWFIDARAHATPTALHKVEARSARAAVCGSTLGRFANE